MAIAGVQRFLVGGLGGLAPVVALLAVVDVDQHLTQITTLKFVGHCVKVAALFAMGGFIAWLHESETKLFKIFEIGLGAPALIAGVIATNTVAQAKAPDKKVTSLPAAEFTAKWQLPETRSSLDFLMGSAHAQTRQPDVPPSGSISTAQPRPQVASQGQATVQTQVTKRFEPPAQSALGQFYEGLTGSQPARRWYVIAGSYVQPEDAMRYANEMNKRVPLFKAEVYGPSEGKKYYGVVLGANLTSSEAVALRDKAIEVGFPSDTYIKSFSNLH
jgi:SPOR domain